MIVLNILQRKIPKFLPNKLRDWTFLPNYLHSLEPYDKFIKKYFILCTKVSSRKNGRFDQVATISSHIELTLKDNKPRYQDSNLLHNSNLYNIDKIQNYQVFNYYLKT